MTSAISDQFFQSDNLAYLPMLQQDLLQHQRFNVAAQVTKAYLTTNSFKIFPIIRSQSLPWSSYLPSIT